jgi:phospholipid-binding lipoprotein MlaA
MLKVCRFLIIFLSIIMAAPAFCHAEDLQEAVEEEDGFEFDDEFDDEFEDEFTDEEFAATYDPLIRINRWMFTFNDKMYFWLLKPVSKGYGYILPEPPRKGINRFFLNLSFPKRFVNNLLQMKWKYAGIETARFGINTFFGILGFWDPAEKYYGLTIKKEDFGQTLAVYGVGEGVPLMVPIFGASNLRDALALIPDLALNPLFFVPDALYVSIALATYEKVNYVSLHIGEYEAIKADALDPYTFIRDGYKQIRRKQVEE